MTCDSVFVHTPFHPSGVITILTRKQHELLAFIDERLRVEGVSPSFEEMKDAINLSSKSGIHRLLTALVERGFVRRIAHRARALEVIRMPEVKPKRPAANVASNDVVSLPLYGRIAAGLPIEAVSGSSRLEVPAMMLGVGEFYALEVSGDSMVEAGILDGDYALIRRSQNARDGEIVVALVDDAEATLKYFRHEGSMIRLDPANRSYDPQRYQPTRIKVQGCLAGIVRRYD